MEETRPEGDKKIPLADGYFTIERLCTRFNLTEKEVKEASIQKMVAVQVGGETRYAPVDEFFFMHEGVAYHYGPQAVALYIIDDEASDAEQLSR